MCPVHDINAHFVSAFGIIAGSLVFFVYSLQFVYVIGPGLSTLYLSNLAWEVVCPLMWTTVCPVHDINAHFVSVFGIIAGSLVFFVFSFQFGNYHAGKSYRKNLTNL